jgi:hypothetical protein
MKFFFDRNMSRYLAQALGKLDRENEIKHHDDDPRINTKTTDVDTWALQVIYALNEIDSAVFVGQRVDVFIDAGKQTDEVDSLEPNSWRTLAR